MFVQVIEGRVKDRAGIESERERWERELMPQATGFLGSTGGITQDGRLIMVARFEDEEQASKNSDRPEQGEWWASFSQHLEGEANFFNSSEVVISGKGGSDDAGFVQVMHGRVTDVAKARELDERMEQEMPDKRPDVIGSLTTYDQDGTFWTVIYFTSLEEARRGEKEMNENPPAGMQEWGALMAGDMTFYDLEEPWFSTK